MDCVVSVASSFCSWCAVLSGLVCQPEPKNLMDKYLRLKHVNQPQASGTIKCHATSPWFVRLAYRGLIDVGAHQPNSIRAEMTHSALRRRQEIRFSQHSSLSNINAETNGTLFDVNKKQVMLSMLSEHAKLSQQEEQDLMWHVWLQSW